ncbi:CYTH domain-containing protein [Microbacterium sp.]|uniref:CYTH domain-containing protein n=1 Tax=Microbacterium sp. TaxID=51671 RepID=UPI0037C96B3D
MTPSEPARSVEVELKFDVDADTALPELGELPGVAVVTAGEVRDLDARYYDTAEFALAHRGFALRRRTGGPDAGWHLKGPLRAGGRTETQWPLGEPGEVPAAVREELARVVDASLPALQPIARIRNRRVAVQLRDAAGGMLAEFADDHVLARDERTRMERRWREWEFELGPAAPADRRPLFEAFARSAAAAGARPASSASKLARALGL